MSKYSCTRRLTFCAGHRIMKHESKCANMHGHNYVAEITIESTELDVAGRVIDFSIIKEEIGAWLDRNWDHGFIVEDSDTKCLSLLETLSKELERGQKFFVMNVSPTAENMAIYLKNVAQELLSKRPGKLIVKQVKLWETENCYAEAI